jgi:hypothetical protein
MGATSKEVKQRWNSSHYTQVKVSVPPELATAFKAKCMAGGLSVASELSRFMRAETSVKHAPKQASKMANDPYCSRPLRRKAVATLFLQLEAILDAERDYLENIPSNLQCSHFYEAAELSVSVLEDALNNLSEAY